MVVAVAVGADHGPDLPAGASAPGDPLPDHVAKNLPPVMAALVSAVAVVAPETATPFSVRPATPWTILRLRGANSRLGTCPWR